MQYKSSFLQDLYDRQLVNQCTNISLLDELLNRDKPIVAYLGFDVNSNSLHVGHLIQLKILQLLQQHGHTPLVLIGGATTKIGDPTFKITSRPILMDSVIQTNAECITKFFQRILNNNNPVIYDNNKNWLDNMGYLEFLDSIGRYISVNRMVGMESVKTRLCDNNSISFLEFNYMLLQAYDFLMLHDKYGCVLQIGGSDQWGNIVIGVELGQKLRKIELIGLTTPLLTTADGKKMGKSEAGAIWLESDRYSIYDYWQYWRNIDDTDVYSLSRMLTEVPVIADINQAKIALADYMTNMVHGSENLNAIHAKNNLLFNKNTSFDSSDLTISEDFVFDFVDIDNITIEDLCLKVQLCDSKTQIKNLIAANGIYINNILAIKNMRITQQYYSNNIIYLRKGKKNTIIIKVC